MSEPTREELQAAIDAEERLHRACSESHVNACRPSLERIALCRMAIEALDRRAQTCENCVDGGHCEIQEVAEAVAQEVQLFGCTAHQPKEGK